MTGRILPRVKTAAFVEASRRIAGMTDDQMPVTVDMAGDLRLAFAVEEGDRFTFVTREWAGARGMDSMALMGEALANVHRAAEHLSVKNLGPVHQLQLPDDLSAASYYLHDFWDEMGRRLGAAPLAVFAHRNFVAFTSVANGEGRKFLEYAAQKAGAEDGHGLSRYLYAWGGPMGWSTWPDHGAGEERQVVEQPVDDWFEDRDGEGYLEFPSRFLCPDCQEVTFELTPQLLAASHRAREKGDRSASALPEGHARALAAVEKEFVAASPQRIGHALRCGGCDAAILIGFEAAGARYRPLAVWTTL